MNERLVRPRQGRMIAGVAAGIAQRYGWDPTLVRLAFVLSVLLPGPQVVLYLAAWLIIPEEPAPELPPHYQGPPVPPPVDTALSGDTSPPPVDTAPPPPVDTPPPPVDTPRPPVDTPPPDETSPPPAAPPSAG